MFVELYVTKLFDTQEQALRCLINSDDISYVLPTKKSNETELCLRNGHTLFAAHGFDSVTLKLLSK